MNLALLVALVGLVHYGYEPMAELYQDQRAAARAIFYVFRGVEGTALWLIVWRLANKGTRAYRVGLGLVCGWGALENAQTAVCRLALGVGEAVSPSAYRGLCDVATGLPVYGVMCLVALAVAAFVGESGNEQ